MPAIMDKDVKEALSKGYEFQQALMKVASAQCESNDPIAVHHTMQMVMSVSRLCHTIDRIARS